MAKILRMSDRLKVTVGDVVFMVGPLSREQKRQIGECKRVVAGEEQVDLHEANAILLKYGLKEMHGVTDFNGDPYALEFDGNGLTEDCLSEILNMEHKDKLAAAAWQTVSGLTDEVFKDDFLPGVALELVPIKKPDS